MPVIPHSETRRTKTPNGVMTTLASPSQGGTVTALWKVEMLPGVTGPYHAFDTEQIWTVLAGGASVELGDEVVPIATGDTLVMPAGVPRRMRTDAVEGMTAIATAPAGALVYNPDGVSENDACSLAPKDAERLTPPWIV